MQAHGQVAQTLAMRQLRKDQGQEMIKRGESAWWPAHGKKGRTTGEFGRIEAAHDLGKNRAASKHSGSLNGVANSIEDIPSGA
jgi:hypothetical protein